MIDPRLERLSDALNVSMATILDAMNDDEKAHNLILGRIQRDIDEQENN
jgi:hypothetical protein